MENNDVISIKKDLEAFEAQKKQLLETFNNEINASNTSKENVECYMAAIIYEHKRLETKANLRATTKEPMCQTEEGRIRLLLNFIRKTFNPNQINEILGALSQADYNIIQNNPQLIMSIMPSIEKIAKPVLDKIDLLKNDLQKLYLSHNIPFMHISPMDIQDGHINPSKNLENQPQNEIMTGVFATSSYYGMNLYMARAIAGGMIANREKVQYPKNPFLSVEEQTHRDRIKLLRPIYAYALNANGFEPQLHFAPVNNGFRILFGDEWVKSTDKPIPFTSKEIITEVDSEPFLKIDTRYVDEKNRRIPSFSDEFARKFNIKLNKNNREQDYLKEK